MVGGGEPCLWFRTGIVLAARGGRLCPMGAARTADLIGRVVAGSRHERQR